jgi:two-component system nitrogen regulation response regulator GlnG
MGSGREIFPDDLPAELRDEVTPSTAQIGSWQEGLRQWAQHHLSAGKQAILDDAMPDFETIMIETALAHTGGRKQDAARLLGWGRNTLTRKLKELGLEETYRITG